MIIPSTVNITVEPKVYLRNSVPSYVDHFKNLAHITSSDMSDDPDIDRERSSLE